MRLLQRTLAVLFALGMIMLLEACSNPPRFEFVAKTEEVPVGTHVVEVWLRNNLSGVLVEDASISATALDMSPDGMSETKAAVEPQGSTTLGVYRFKAEFTMPGRWRLGLTARVPGEPNPVTGAVLLTAK